MIPTTPRVLRDIAISKAMILTANNIPVSQLTNGNIVTPTVAPTVKNSIRAMMLPTKNAMPSNTPPIDSSISM